MNNHQPIIIYFHQEVYILATLLNPQVKAEAAATLLQKVDAIKQSITQESVADLLRGWRRRRLGGLYVAKKNLRRIRLLYCPRI